jgi:flagellar motor switch/type III secretory pathway protein FliN
MASAIVHSDGCKVHSRVRVKNLPYVTDVRSRRILPWRPRASCRRVDVDSWRRVRSACETYADLSSASRTLDSLVGSRIRVHLRTARRQTLVLPLEDGVALELAGLDGRSLDATLEVETPLAVAMTAMALKRPPPRIAGVVGDAEIASLGGGLAAILLAASRSLGGPIRVRAAGSSAAMLAKRLAEGDEVDAATLVVSVDDRTFVARFLLHGEPSRPNSSAFGAERLASLGATPLEIPIVADTALSTVTDLASLDIGDAWMLGPAPWARTLRGDVVLAAPGSERGARASLVENGALVLRAGSEELRGYPMPEEDGPNDSISVALGDVPVVVRVEVGAARMTAREWASLAVGDVVGLARDIADPVTLRVAGVEIAKGELVDIEGEMGVRILSLHGAGRAP